MSSERETDGSPKPGSFRDLNYVAEWLEHEAGAHGLRRSMSALRLARHAVQQALLVMPGGEAATRPHGVVSVLLRSLDRLLADAEVEMGPVRSPQ